MIDHCIGRLHGRCFDGFLSNTLPSKPTSHLSTATLFGHLSTAVIKHAKYLICGIYAEVLITADYSVVCCWVHQRCAQLLGSSAVHVMASTWPYHGNSALMSAPLSRLLPVPSNCAPHCASTCNIITKSLHACEPTMCVTMKEFDVSNSCSVVIEIILSQVGLQINIHLGKHLS